MEHNSWEIITPLARPRSYHACALLEDEIYVLGGSKDDSTEVLNVSSHTWTSGPGLLKSGQNINQYGQALTYKGSLYFISREGRVDKLNPDKSGWSTIARIGNIRYRRVYPALIVHGAILNF